MWSSSHAYACELEQPAKLALEENPSDVEPPSTPEVSVVEITRGEHQRPDACVPGVGNSCDDIATLELAVSASDDTSTTEQLGYVLELLDDDPGLELSPDPVVSSDGTLRLQWSGDDGIDDLSFRLRVWAVDRAGHRSAQSAMVQVESEGTRGCRLGRASHEGVTWLMVLFALSLARRRTSTPCSRDHAPRA